MLSAELDNHLETEAEAGTDNRRNGSSKKTMLTGTSKVTLDIPRDRPGTFNSCQADRQVSAPVPGVRRQDRLDVCAGHEECARSRGTWKSSTASTCPQDLISTITDAVLETVTEWQGRPLDACYPLVFFDAIR